MSLETGMKFLKGNIGKVMIVAALAAGAAFAFSPAGPAGATGGSLVVDTFSGIVGRDGSPQGWKPLIFPKVKRLTSYMVTKQGDGYVLKASSDQAASGIYKELDLDLKEYPILSWRWKVDRVLKGGNALTKEGDDYPARVYVTFAFEPEKASYFERIKYMALKSTYGESLPGKAITYIWANRLEKGAITPNAFLSQFMMIAVQSGPERAGQWVEEERDVYRDFKKCFNAEPPRITGIAVMTDTDNTRENATAYYDDIVFKRKPREEHPYSLARKGAADAGQTSIR
jgi:hypothetical protein